MTHSSDCVCAWCELFGGKGLLRVSSPCASDVPDSVVRSGPVEVVNCAPIAGRDEECRRFPRAGA